ncbi:MAG: hypothetical protein NW217_04650 [Hyphomicrobiaceae bacterium]|nr:hypothetical protein [Hyphomicrobiaceae bacterium]
MVPTAQPGSGKAQGPPQTASVDDAGQSATTGNPPNERSEAEVVLERELAVLLSRTPKRVVSIPQASRPAPANLDDGPHIPTARVVTPPPLRMSPGTRPKTRAQDIDAASFDDGEAVAATEPHANTTGRGTIPAGSRRWLEIARRSRRNAGWRSAASWIVSIGVVVFILVAVLLIVVGPPKGMLAWPSLEAPATDAGSAQGR